MKKKLFTIFGILLVCLFPNNIQAATPPSVIEDVVIDQSGNFATDFKFNEYDSQAHHYQAVFSTNISLDGNCYAAQGAFCVTPGATNHPAGGYKCKLVNDANSNVTQYTLASGIIMKRNDIDYMHKAVALRMLTAVKNQTACAGVAKCTYIMNGYKEYYKKKTGVASANPAAYFNVGFESSEVLNTAVDIVKAALQSAESNPNPDSYSYMCEPTNASVAQQFVVRIVPVSCGGCNTTEDLGDIFVGDANNCCEEDTHSTLKDGVLDDLFSDDGCLGVVKYTPKRNTEGYKVSDSQLVNDAKNYCELYCSERIEIVQPGAFNLALNHQFELNKVTYNGVEYKSPVVDNYRRCRVRVKFHEWAQAYSNKINEVNTAYNKYLKAKRLKEYYEYAANHKTIYEGAANSSKIHISATCTKDGSITPCPNYSSATNVGGCTAQYNACETGYTEVDGKCKRTTTKNATGDKCTSPYTYNATNDNCEEIKDKTISGYSCPDTTQPSASISDSSKTKDIYFNGRIYNFGSSTYSYLQYKVNNTSGTYRTEPDANGNRQDTQLFKNFSIVSAGYSYGSHAQYAAHSTEGASVTERINELNNFVNTTSAGMAGTKTCAHSSNSTYYNVTCSVDLGVLEVAKDASGNVIDEDVENMVPPISGAAKYTEEMNNAATAYSTAVQQVDKLIDNLYVCNNYFSEFNGSNPNSYQVNPVLNFTYDQFYINDLGNVTSQRVPVKFTRHCETQPVQVPNTGEYNNPGALKQISEESNVDSLISSRYSNAYGNQIITNRLYTCVRTASGACDTAATAAQLATGNINNILANQSVKPAFEYDAVYNTLCYWEPDNEVFVAAGTGTVKFTQFEGTNQNNGKKYVYMFSDHTLTGIFQIYPNLSNIGTVTASKEKIQNALNNTKTCAKQTMSEANNIDKWSTFTCKYKAYSFESKIGYCDDNHTGIPVIDPAHCDKESKLYYSFKVVDENNLFPNCANTDTPSQMEACYNNISYGYNWLDTADGQTALKEIQTTNNYDRSNITYSFKLNSQAMKAIKEYNKTRISHGGYEDFNFTCDGSNNTPKTCNVALDTIPGSEEHMKMEFNGDIVDVVYYDRSCSRCYSNFLSKLANNQVGDQTLAGDRIWNRSTPLSEVRNNLSW